MEKTPDRGSGIRDENPRSFENLVSVFGLKVLKFFDADPGSCQPWIWDGKVGFWILNKHPGSATLTLLQDILLFHDLNLYILLLK
jgi:hypothetical protein